MSEWFTTLDSGTAWLIIIGLLFIGAVSLVCALNALAEVRAERESHEQPVEYING